MTVLTKPKEADEIAYVGVVLIKLTYLVETDKLVYRQGDTTLNLALEEGTILVFIKRKDGGSLGCVLFGHRIVIFNLAFKHGIGAGQNPPEYLIHPLRNGTSQARADLLRARFAFSKR